MFKILLVVEVGRNPNRRKLKFVHTHHVVMRKINEEVRSTFLRISGLFSLPAKRRSSTSSIFRN
jgi:hypothetical protein